MRLQLKMVEVFEHKIGLCFHVFSCLEGKCSIIKIEHTNVFEEVSVRECLCRVADDSS